MRYYSDLFSVGVLIIYLPDAEFDKLHNTTDLDEVDLSDFDIVEQLSASGHYVSPTHQFTFLKNLGLDTVPRVQTH